jgi:Fe(3+) dicitrate transport protein
MKPTRLSILLAAIAAGPAIAQQAQPPVAPPASPAPANAQQGSPPVAPQAVPQSAAPKATGGAGSTLPQVEIIQQPKAAQPAPAAKAAPKAAAPAPAPTPKAAVAPKAAPKAVAPVAAKKTPAPVAVAPPPVEPAADVSADPNPVYGAANSGGAAERATQSSQTPINPRSLTPTNLQGFSAAATNIDAEALAEQKPRNVNDMFKQVPGVIVVNDDASGHHGGISLRGSPPRRSRKVLVMEDGQPVNLALWLDPSVHYWAPVDRLESVEVLRGTVITHGPHNNFGVINARNLSPFGAPETVISAAIGFTQTRAGSYTDANGVVHTGNSEWDLSSRWHVHTRQHAGNVGLVASYTGENVQGAWDTERLRFHDFYGAIGWKGIDQDLTVSVVYARQKDNYDEANLVGDEDGAKGNAEAAFFEAKHCKTCFAPGAFLNTYQADILRAQITHNMFVDKDTTLTTKLYGGTHRRDRFQTLYNSSNPAAPEASGIGPGYSDEYVTADGKILRDAFVGNDSMFGRLRTFRHIGVEGRAEFANQPLIGGVTQDIQVGLRYEHQDMKNRNFLGKSGEILKYGDSEGLTIFDRSLKSDAISAFLQTSIKATSDLRIVPGVRLEWYKVRRKTRVAAVEEGEADEFEDGVDFNDSGQTCSDALTNYGEDECHVIAGLSTRGFEDSTSSLRALPGIAFSYTGLYRTTVYGGYHRGQTKLVLRNEDFPAADEIGDNFELGIRTSAVRGITLEVAGFHQRLKNFQYGASFSTAGDRSFGTADEVHINGVEIAGRIDSQPWIGGPLNLYTQGQYTYARSIIKRGTTEDGNGNVVDLAGKHLPEVPFHIAALTLGLEGRTGWKWNASATYTYRGAFFTDEVNTAYGGDPEGENGTVPGIWLLSARFNLDIGNTGASVFVSGDNLLDKLYITDREDGIKPGIGRTIWTGFKYKF